MKVKIKKFDSVNSNGCDKVKSFVPVYQTEGSVGCDLLSTVTHAISPGEAFDIPTGIGLELPAGYEAQVRGRSGLWFKHRVMAFQGTIDSDYRGEIQVSLINMHPTETLLIQPGDRIAQMIIAKTVRCEFEEVEELSTTERDEGGFGSTGGLNSLDKDGDGKISLDEIIREDDKK